MGAATKLNGERPFGSILHFNDQLDAGRFGCRSSAFDEMIRASQVHFWDPLDPRYIDFKSTFNLATQPLLPFSMAPALLTPYGQEQLPDRQQQIAFVNDVARWQFSSMLYGEQGALALSANLCHRLHDVGAQEYAANQAREEARHVTAFGKYIQARWGRPDDCGPALKSLLRALNDASDVNHKIVGMQVIVEGLAMGAFATGYQTNKDPLARRLFQLVMTDEAFHHRFGEYWAGRVLPELSEAERNEIEDWVAYCFSQAVLNLVSPHQMANVYEAYGLDVDRVAKELQAQRFADDIRRHEAKPSSMLKVVVGTLLRKGLVTERTREMYPAHLSTDMGEDIGAHPVVEEGIALLERINASSRESSGWIENP